MATETSLVLMIVLPFVGSALAAFLRPNTRNGEFWLSGAVALATLVLAISCYPALSGGTPVRADVEWVPSLGVAIDLRVDAFSLLMIVLVSGIGALVFAYGHGYFSGSDKGGRVAGLEARPRGGVVRRHPYGLEGAASRTRRRTAIPRSRWPTWTRMRAPSTRSARVRPWGSIGTS